MRQPRVSSPRVPYADLLDALAPGDALESIVAEVARDVAGQDEDPVVVAAAVRPAVEWTLRVLRRDGTAAERLSPDDAARLTIEGAAAARAGETLQRLLDRYLTSGWVLWGAATRGGSDRPADPAALAALGTALLRAGDTAASALADGFGEAEREAAARTAAARREFLDEILDLPPGDPAAVARLARRAAHFGLATADSYRVLVAGVGRDLEDDAPELSRVVPAVERPARPGHPGTPGPETARPALVAAKRGRLLVVARAGWQGDAVLERALDDAAPGGWLLVEGPTATGLTDVGSSFEAAIGSLLIAERLALRGRLAATDLLLERALLADERLLARAVGRELGPLLGAPRIGDALVATLEAYLATGQNRRATARALGIGPRTVAYRLARVEALLGRRLDGPALARIATALLARRLVTGPFTGPADPPPPAPFGRSPRHRAAARAR